MSGQGGVLGIGHNGGPSMEGGQSFRRYAWSQARIGLLGERLPIEVLRRRVKRAEALGLPYRNYASIRAASGRDVIGFLFSSNALRMVRRGDRMPAQFADRLAALPAARLAALHAPLGVQDLEGAEFEAAGPAPRPFAPWGELRAQVDRLRAGLPGDGVLLIADAPFEAEWAAAGKLAGIYRGAQFFGA